MSGLQNLILKNDFFKVPLVQNVKTFDLLLEFQIYENICDDHHSVSSFLCSLDMQFNGVVEWAGTLWNAVHSLLFAKERVSNYLVMLLLVLIPTMMVGL